MKEFGDWLRAARTRAGLSQADLAEEARRVDAKRGAGVHQGRITDWELGKRLPMLRQLVAMSRALGLSENEARAGRELWDAAQLEDLPSDHDASDHDASNQPVGLDDPLTVPDFPDLPTLP